MDKRSCVIEKQRDLWHTLRNLSSGWPPTPESLAAGVDAWKKAERVGVRAKVPTPLGL